MPNSSCQKGFVQILVLVVLVVTLVTGGAYYLGRQTTQHSSSPTPTPPLSSTSQDCKVTGCSGEVCAEAENAEEIFTDCEWRSEYACYKNARCERQSGGKCGWTQDEALTKCLGGR